jgi:translation initiation factor 1
MSDGTKTVMPVDEIFYKCCVDGFPIPDHIKETYSNHIYETLVVHVRIQQRNNRKKFTTIQGLPDRINFNRIMRACRTLLRCGGAVVNNREYGQVIQLQGSYADEVRDFLVRIGLCRVDNVHIHGES